MDDVTALWFTARGEAELRREQPSVVGEGWCAVDARYSAVSSGTERLVFTGGVPAELAGEMRCPYMDGEFPFPVKYGYSLVGVVADGPAELVGDAVHVLHPHQDRCVVRVADVHRVPAAVPLPRATLASNLETAVNALWDARVAIGDRVCVVGFGVVGSLVARLASFVPGVAPVVAEAAPAKRQLATDLGFDAPHPDEIGEGFDVAIHASATAAGLQFAVDHVGFEGRVVELSWYGTREVTLRLGGDFHSRRKRIVSSQVSTIAPAQRPRWDHERRKDLVFELLARAEFDEHISGLVAFDDAATSFGRLVDGSTAGLTHVIDYTNGGTDDVQRHGS